MLCDQIINFLSRSEISVDLDQRISPQKAVSEGLIDCLPYGRISDGDKALYGLLVISDNFVSEFEDLHGRYLDIIIKTINRIFIVNSD